MDFSQLINNIPNLITLARMLMTPGICFNVFDASMSCCRCASLPGCLSQQITTWLTPMGA